MMWEQAKYTVDPTIAAASSLLTAVALVMLLIVLGFQRLSRAPAAAPAD
jgi:ABC-type spermidine/putrescine transport system permease subunit II